MPTATTTPTIDPLAAWVLKRLTCTPPMDLAGVDPATLPAPWDAVAVAVRDADPKDRTRVLSRELLDQDTDPTVVALELAGVNQNDPPPQPPKPRYTLHWAREALEAPAPMEWLVEGVMPAGGTGVIFGDPGSKKTWCGLHLAVSVALGADWLGRPVKHGPVLIVDEESGDSRMRRRLKAVMAGLNAPAGLPLAYTCLAGFKPGDPTDLAELDALVGAVQPVLVLVDALADVMLGNENSVEDVMPVLQGLRQLAERHSCLVLLIHHSNRQSGSYRGSSAIAGAVDLMLSVESKPDSPNVDFEVTKSRDAEPCSFSATASWSLIDDSFTLVEAPKVKTAHYSAAEEYVIRYLTEHGPSLLADIESHADVCSPSYARKAAYSLARKAVIRRCDPGGPGAKATYELTPEQEYDPWQEAMDA